MGIEILSAGSAVKWAAETTAGTRPTTGYTTLQGVTAISANNEAPNMHQTTKLSATVSHTAIPGLAGGGLNAQAISVNDYDVFRTSWAALVSAYDTATAAGKGFWIEYAYPPNSGMDSYYYQAQPISLGYGGAEVDAVMVNTAYLAMTGQPEFAAASA